MIVKCAKNTNTLFYLAEVISNNADGSLTIQWWAPSAISKNKNGKYHSIAFKAQTVKHRIENRKRGAPQWRLKPQLDNNLKVQHRVLWFLEANKGPKIACRSAAKIASIVFDIKAYQN